MTLVTESDSPLFVFHFAGTKSRVIDDGQSNANEYFNDNEDDGQGDDEDDEDEEEGNKLTSVSLNGDHCRWAGVCPFPAYNDLLMETFNGH